MHFSVSLQMRRDGVDDSNETKTKNENVVEMVVVAASATLREKRVEGDSRQRVVWSSST